MIQTTGVVSCCVCGKILGYAPTENEMQAFREGEAAGSIGMMLPRLVNTEQVELILSSDACYCRPHFEEAITLSMQMSALGRRPHSMQ